MTSRYASLGRHLLLLGLLLLVGCATSEPRTPVPATPPATPSPPVKADLERVATFPGPRGSAVTSLTAGGPGFVAVGFDGTDRAMVWVSINGLEWTAVPHGNAFANASMAAMFEEASLAAIARIPDGIIAGGYQETDAAAWISSDAETWTRLDEGPGLHNAYFTTMVAGGERLVVGGATQMRVTGTGSFTQAATAWFSPPFASAAP